MDGERNRPEAPLLYVCPFCGNEQWAGQVGTNQAPALVVLPIVDAEGNPSLVDAVTVVALSCTVCGFVRLHNPDTIS